VAARGELPASAHRGNLDTAAAPRLSSKPLPFSKEPSHAKAQRRKENNILPTHGLVVSSCNEHERRTGIAIRTSNSAPSRLCVRPSSRAGINAARDICACSPVIKDRLGAIVLGGTAASADCGAGNRPQFCGNNALLFTRLITQQFWRNTGFAVNAGQRPTRSRNTAPEQRRISCGPSPGRESFMLRARVSR
jgi:hypothetical protein